MAKNGVARLDPRASRRSSGLTVEVFPPARPEGIDALADNVQRLFALSPEFASVTYGAGGSTRERSLSAVKRLLHETQGKVAAHVTCVACSATETDRVVDDFLEMGVTRFFALRGDVPGAGQASDSYPDAVSLVSALRRRGVRDISVAAYPDVHPKAASAHSDIDVLKAKIDAGATRAVTQFFLDNRSFYRFRDRLAHDGFTAPLIPGVLLFEDFSRAVTFAERCGTAVPEAARRRFAPFAADPAGARAEARRFLAEQIADLEADGVERFHLYTLNRSELAVELFSPLPEDIRETAAA
ncbi:MAG: methylenetetrahydrofolate reductase [Parvibaculaceae bacterium]